MMSICADLFPWYVSPLSRIICKAQARAFYETLKHVDKFYTKAQDEYCKWGCCE